MEHAPVIIDVDEKDEEEEENDNENDKYNNNNSTSKGNSNKTTTLNTNNNKEPLEMSSESDDDNDDNSNKNGSKNENGHHHHHHANNNVDDNNGDDKLSSPSCDLENSTDPKDGTNNELGVTAPGSDSSTLKTPSGGRRLFGRATATARSGSGNNNNNNNNNNNKTAASRKQLLPPDLVLRRLMQEATYELEHDAYRGMARYTTVVQEETTTTTTTTTTKSPEGGAAVPMDVDVDDDKDVSYHSAVKISPWEVSCSPFTLERSCQQQLESISVDEDGGGGAGATRDGDLSVPEKMVFWACHNQCPTLIQWTERAIELSNRHKPGGGRKRRKAALATTSACPPKLGQRPNNTPNIRCRCDANPFCLNTLGGVMNDVILRDLNRTIHPLGGSGGGGGDAEREFQHQWNNNSTDHNMQSAAGGGGGGGGETEENGGTTTTSGGADNKDDDGDVVEVLDSTDSNRPETREKLKEIRRSTWIEVDRVRSYLKWTLQDLATTQTIDKYIGLIRKHHQDLIFQNPVDETEHRPTHIQISIPPGIQNLGATCYLNTQLQCLAQNLIFLKGIFSWEPPKRPEHCDRMVSVLQLFQGLLVSMHAGPMTTTNTLQFSNALGLDHYEQQDPNEFSKFFFERMHESFKKNGDARNNETTTTTSRSREKQQYDLSSLLPQLFQGVIRYETTCLHKKCKVVSTRKEEFMDINLTITKPEEVEETTKKKSFVQKTILELFSSSSNAASVDVDVQTCLDRYCLDETLTGDNQYYCSSCNEKRDATRHLCFQKLPPILNVQLSRYIYDLKAQTKKKLMEKVLLPRTLIVEESEQPNNNNNTEEERQHQQPQKKEYVLCAVMRHQGKSAYSGHYIAEAMDWATGEWFEFNDEKVSLLKTGPSNSYELFSSKNNSSDATTSTESSSVKAKKLPAGSQDAYNLYYVEKDFLSTSVFEYFAEQTRPSVLENAAMGRAAVYQDLSQRCLDDRMIQNRLQRRKELILEKMFHPRYKETKITRNTQFVFVESDFLRWFFSGEKWFKEEGDDIKRRYNLADNNNRRTCFHGLSSIHPRDARKGKLLPLEMFESMVEIIQETEECENPEHFGIPSKGLRCNLCQESYRRDLEMKLKVVGDALYLHEMLDPNMDEAAVVVSVADSSCSTTTGGGDAVDDDDHVYLVSRKFITAFRNEVARLMKRADSVDLTDTPDNAILRTEGEFPGEGFDALDFMFPGIVSEVDASVNKAITCEHGNCSNNVSKRNVRFISGKLWKMIKSFFPQALQHRKPKSADDTYLRCHKCESEDLVVDTLNSILQDLAKKFRSSLDSRKLDCDNIIQGGTGPYRLVHNDDIKALDTFCNHFKKAKGKTSADSIKEKLSEIFFTKSRCEFSKLPQSLGGSAEAYKAEHFSKFFRPLVCHSHGKAFKTALQGDPDPTRPFPLLDHGLAVLYPNKYMEFMKQLCAISVVFSKLARRELLSCDLGCDADGGTVMVDAENIMKDAEAICERSVMMDAENIMKDAEAICERSNVEECHPSVEWIFRRTADSDSLFCMESPASVFLRVQGGVCSDPECNRSFKEWSGENMESNKLSAAINTTTSSNEPISIDCDDDITAQKQTLSLPVVEVDEEANDEKIVEYLAQTSGMPSAEAFENPTIRRSSRRKKTRMPLGVIISEESVQFDFTDNLASLRLLLMERCQQGAAFALGHGIKLVVWPKSKPTDMPDVLDDDENNVLDQSQISSPPVIIELSFAMNEKPLLDICEEHTSTKWKVSDLENRVYLIRTTQPDPSATDIPDENLMDHLISLSSVCTEKQPKNGKRKKPAAEKGFTGTFLTSGSSTLSNSDSPPVTNGSITTPIKSALKDEGSLGKGESTIKKARFSDSTEIADSAVSGGTGSKISGDPDGDNVGLLGSAKATQMSCSPSPTEEENDFSEMAVELARLLVTAEAGREESICMKAASWAVQNNPDAPTANSLIDHAFAKYLELAQD